MSELTPIAPTPSELHCTIPLSQFRELTDKAAALDEVVELLAVIHRRQGVLPSQLQQIERMLRGFGFAMRRA